MKRNFALVALFLAAGIAMAEEPTAVTRLFANSLQTMCKGVGGDAVPTVRSIGPGLEAIILYCPNPRGNPLVVREELNSRAGEIDMEFLDAPVGVIKTKSDLFKDVLSLPLIHKYSEDGDLLTIYRWDDTVLKVWINNDGRLLQISGLKKDFAQIEAATRKTQ